MAGEGFHPLPEQARRASDKRHHLRQLGGKPPRFEAGAAPGVEAFYAQLRPLLPGPLPERLAHQDIIRSRAHGQPVARLWPGTYHQLKIAIGGHRQRIHLHMAGRGHIATADERTGLALDAEIGHRAAVAADTVVQAAIHRAVEVAIVRVVVADLGGLVGEGVKLGEIGIPELQVLFQPEAQQAGEVAKTLGPGELIGRVVSRQYLLAGLLQRVAKVVPEAALDQRQQRVFRSGVVRHSI